MNKEIRWASQDKLSIVASQIVLLSLFFFMSILFLPAPMYANEAVVQSSFSADWSGSIGVAGNQGGLDSGSIATAERSDGSARIQNRSTGGVIPVPFDVTFRQTEARSMLSFVNSARASVGAQPLQWDEELEATAMLRAAEITVLFEHTRPDGSDCFTAFPAGSGAVGENIAMGFSSAWDTFTQWMGSPGHYSNMVNSDFNSIGIACVSVDVGGYSACYWVQCFGSSAGSGQTSGAYDGSSTVAINVPDSFIVDINYDDSSILLGVSETAALPSCNVTLYGEFSNGTYISGTLTLYSSFFDWSSSTPGVIGFSSSPQEGAVIVSGYTMGNSVLTATTDYTSRLSMTVPAQVMDIARLGGGLGPLGTRFYTMQEISKEGFDSSEWAVVALGDNFPDSLSASAIAGALRCPILLTSGSSLSDEVVDEISRLGVSKIAVIGSENAVSEPIYQQLSNLDGISHIERISGADRVDTSIEVARRTQQINDSSDTIILALASNFPDGISASSYAWSTSSPLILCDAWGLTPNAKQFIEESGCKRVVIIGSEDVLPDSIANDIRDMGLSVERVCGGSDGGNGYPNNRYGTSMAMADFALSEGLGLSGSVVVTGENFPDALAGGALAGSNNGCVLLVGNTEANMQPVYDKLHGSDATGVRILGSESAVTAQAYQEVKEALAS